MVILSTQATHTFKISNIVRFLIVEMLCKQTWGVILKKEVKLLCENGRGLRDMNLAVKQC